MLFNEKVIKYDEKCKILIKSRYKVKSPLSEKVTYNLYHCLAACPSLLLVAPLAELSFTVSATATADVAGLASSVVFVATATTHHPFSCPAASHHFGTKTPGLCRFRPSHPLGPHQSSSSFFVTPNGPKSTPNSNPPSLSLLSVSSFTSLLPPP